MSNRVTIEMDADEAKFVAKMLAAAKGPKQLKEEAAKAVKESKALERAAKRVYDETRTPAEQHNRRMQELNALLKKGKIDQETYNRAAEQAGHANREAFGPRALGHITAYLGGIIASVASLRTFKQLLSDVRAMEQDAGQRVTDKASGLRAIQGVALGDTDQADRMISIAETARAKHGLDEADAYRLAVKLGSFGDDYMQHSDDFAGLRHLGLDPAGMADATMKLQSVFGTGEGDAGAGSIPQLLAKLMAAAKSSPVTPDELSSAMAVGSLDFKRFGGGDEEMMAALSVASKATRTPLIAAERIKELAAQLASKREFIDSDLQGLELINAMPQLAEQGKLLDENGKPMRLDKFLGSKEAMTGLELINTNYAEIQAAKQGLYEVERQAGGPNDVRKQAIGAALNNVELGSVTASQMSDEELQQALEQRYGSWENLADLVITEREKAAGKQFGGSWNASATRTMLETRRYFEGSEEFVRNEAPSVAAEMDEAAARLNRAAGNLENATRQRTQLSGQRDSE